MIPLPQPPPRDLRWGQRLLRTGAWKVVCNLAVAFVVVFWLATAYWVHKDARHRIEDRGSSRSRHARRVPPFIGPIIYILFRPPEYLEDMRERELEISAIEHGLAKGDLSAPSAAPPSRRRTSSVPSARPGCGRRASSATGRSRRCKVPVLRDADLDAEPPAIDETRRRVEGAADTLDRLGPR